jgi:hypothetical protein
MDLINKLIIKGQQGTEDFCEMCKLLLVLLRVKLPEEVSAAFPGSNCLERRRLLRGDVPLRDGEEL